MFDTQRPLPSNEIRAVSPRVLKTFPLVTAVQISWVTADIFVKDNLASQRLPSVRQPIGKAFSKLKALLRGPRDEPWKWFVMLLE